MFRFRQRLAYALQSIAIAIFFGLLRLLSVDRASDLGGFIGRRFGPSLAISKVGERNLRAAFPEKSDAEIDAILRGAWDNLCRTFAEYSQLDRLWDKNPITVEIDGKLMVGHRRIDFTERQRFLALLRSGKPSIFYTGHCGNWELLPVVAAHYGLPLAVVFRPPNSPYARQLAEKVRRRSMGRLIPTNTMATAAIAAASLERGESLGLLIDQYFGRGVDLPFFGRPARTAPTLAKIAQHFDCPVVGAVVERVKGAHFCLHLLPEVPVMRTPEGDIDVTAMMGAATKGLEDWVRAHPEQWLWFHRRWR